MHMTSVELVNLQKTFGSTNVVRGVDLAIEPGEFVAFVGPSGCGKSTLLRMIAGLETVSDGSIRIDGTDVTRLDPARRGIAMVFQSYALYPHMTVEQNIGFGLEMAGLSADERRLKVQAAAETLHLGELLERKPAQLSGGQRQRVAIGRAIVRNPKVFLFDEPLSNLDAELRVHMRLELARLHARLGATMIYVTHDQVEAMTLASRIVVLRNGRIEQAGTPLDLYGNPDNTFVAGFIGSPRINLLPAHVVSTGGNSVVVDVPSIGVSSLPLKLRQSGGVAGGTVQVGIRPGSFRPAGATPLAASFAVDVVEHLGGVSYVHGRLDGGGAIVAEVEPNRPLSVGSVHTGSIEAAECMVFDASGQRL
jgi:ABC-type sugar transport system ATPase subunit